MRVRRAAASYNLRQLVKERLLVTLPVNELPRLPRRACDAHKGTFGTVLVVAGSTGMAGAAVLAGRAALRGGAGLVRVACPASVLDVVAASYPGYTTIGIRQHTDGTFGDGAAEELIEAAREADVVAIGPGLGRSPAVVAFVRRVLGALREMPAVVDADGLFALSPFNPELLDRAVPLVMTPHLGEFARLTGQPAPTGDAERREQATAFARKFGHVLLLKGAGTLVTDGSRLYRNTTGNPGMATGGSGDVLTGLIAALVGQGLSAFDAAVLGAWVHGRAGDLAAARLGQTALTATDLLDHLPAALREQESTW
jgi:ADP-dependent NAD(P)H-hydrate dehydratase